MARNNQHADLVSLPGFTVFQTNLGSALQFIPALHTPELDSLIDAYIAGTESIQQKRAKVCAEFFTYAARTGQTNDVQLFFPVFAQTDSPGSLSDSGYGSAFNVSPVVPEMMWDASFPATPATPSSAFAGPSSNRVTKAKAASRKATTASSRVSAATANDFSNIPGMKILTKDGVDVTNSASRGSKTKAMREHAHLIRLLKACDSCKKKKVRCDPSHKRRGTTQTPAVVETAKPSKRKSASPPVTPQADAVAQQASFRSATAPQQTFEPGMDLLQDMFDWDQYVQLEDEAFSMPIDLDFTVDAQGMLTPSSGSSASPSQPFTPASAELHAFESYSFPAGLEYQPYPEPPQLPYLQPEGHTADYVDFTLYSPASSFLDEEPQELHTAGPSPSTAVTFTSQDERANERIAIVGRGHERIQQHGHGAVSSGGVSSVIAAVRDGLPVSHRSPRLPDRDRMDPAYSDSRDLHGQAVSLAPSSRLSSPAAAATSHLQEYSRSTDLATPSPDLLSWCSSLSGTNSTSNSALVSSRSSLEDALQPRALAVRVPSDTGHSAGNWGNVSSFNNVGRSTLATQPEPTGQAQNSGSATRSNTFAAKRLLVSTDGNWSGSGHQALMAPTTNIFGGDMGATAASITDVTAADATKKSANTLADVTHRDAGVSGLVSSSHAFFSQATSSQRSLTQLLATGATTSLGSTQQSRARTVTHPTPSATSGQHTTRGASLTAGMVTHSPIVSVLEKLSGLQSSQTRDKIHGIRGLATAGSSQDVSSASHTYVSDVGADASLLTAQQSERGQLSTTALSLRVLFALFALVLALAVHLQATAQKQQEQLLRLQSQEQQPSSPLAAGMTTLSSPAALGNVLPIIALSLAAVALRIHNQSSPWSSTLDKPLLNGLEGERKEAAASTHQLTAAAILHGLECSDDLRSVATRHLSRRLRRWTAVTHC